MSLDLGLVVAVHPEDHSVDLVMVEDGAHLAGVQVLTSAGSIRSGRNDLTAPGAPDQGDKWSISGHRPFDAIATVDYVGRGHMPVVTGFLLPQVCQLLFDRLNFRVDRHASDVYETVDDAGNYEWSHPSGSFLRWAEAPDHEDLAGQDFDKKWAIDRNKSRAPWLSVILANAGTEVMRLRVDPAGNVTLVHSGNLTAHTKGNAAVTVDGSTTVTSTGAAVWNVPAGLTVNGNVATIGSLTNNGKNVGSTHTHGGVAGGAAHTDVPD